MNAFITAVVCLLLIGGAFLLGFEQGREVGSFTSLKVPCSQHSPPAPRAGLLDCAETLRSCRARARMERVRP